MGRRNTTDLEATIPKLYERARQIAEWREARFSGLLGVVKLTVRVLPAVISLWSRTDSKGFPQGTQLLGKFGERTKRLVDKVEGYLDKHWPSKDEVKNPILKHQPRVEYLDLGDKIDRRKFVVRD